MSRGTIKNLLANEVLSGDTCKLLNSDNYYTLIDKLNIRIQDSVVSYDADADKIRELILAAIADKTKAGTGISATWDGTY